MLNGFDDIILYLSYLKELSLRRGYWFNKLLIISDSYDIVNELVNSINKYKLFKNIDVILKSNNTDFDNFASNNCHLYNLNSTFDADGENVIVCGNGMEIAYASYKFRIELLNDSFKLCLGDEVKFGCQRFYLKSRRITNLGKKNYVLSRKVGK